jgi:hypothetical protein
MKALTLLSSAMTRMDGVFEKLDSLETEFGLVPATIVDEVIDTQTRRSEREIMDALDELDGEIRSKTLKALAEVRNTRRSSCMLIKGSALRACHHARNARSHMSHVLKELQPLSTNEIRSHGSARLKSIWHCRLDEPRSQFWGSE